MKKIVFAITAFLTVTCLTAQMKEGTIIYERKINLHKRISDEQMKAMVPEFRSGIFQLAFTDKESLYKSVPQESAPDPFESSTGGTRMMLKVAGDEAEQYLNFSQARLVESRPLGAKTYIIEDSIRQQGWKLTDETKMILNYKCRKAIRENETKQTVEAWYTEDIACPAGPELFAGLPGTILQVDVNKGEIVYTATTVEDKVDRSGIQEPKKGKKITRKDYAKLVEETYGIQPGGGGQRIMIRSM